MRYFLYRLIIRLLRHKEFYSQSGETFWNGVLRNRTSRGSRPSLTQKWILRLLNWKYTELQFGNCPVYSVTHRRWNGQRTVLYLHGGGYVNEAVRTHWFFLFHLLWHSHARVIVPQYPLAPEFSAYDAISAIHDVYASLLETTPPNEIIVMGDSAGGALTLVCAMDARESGLPQPRHLILISPSVEITPPDLPNDPEARELDWRDIMLSWGAFPTILNAWRGKLPEKDWRVQPFYGDLNGLAPMTLFTGTADILHRCARQFRDRVQNEYCGTVSLDYVERRGKFHCWLLLPCVEAWHDRTVIWKLIEKKDAQDGEHFHRRVQED